MARLIKSVNTPVLNATIQTCFEDGSVSDKVIKTGSIIEGLRYVLNGELVTLSGKVVSIEYSLPSRITFSRSKPEDTFGTDVTISSITLDCSDQYNSKIVTVPAIEIVEDEGVENVKRMRVFASLSLNMEMYYSNRTMTSVSLQVGDKVDGARIMTAVPGIDITGEFEVVAFSYARNSNTKFTVDGIVLKNEKDGTFIAALDKILAITEVMTYETSSIEQLAEILTEARDGETIKLSADVNANDAGIVVEGKELTLDLAGKTVTAGNTNDNGITITNGKLTLKGGTLVTDQPYDSDHGSVMVAVRTGGELTLEDCTLSAVMDDPVNKGQFGVGIYNDGKVIVNSGTYEAGWYTVCTEGSTCTPDASITINGGKFVSPVDYAIYLPQGKLFVNDGEIIGGAGAISCNRGYVEINDGVFKTSGDGDTGTTPNGTGGQSPACIDCSCKYGPVDLVIHGGTFTTDNGAPIIHAGTKYTVTVKIDGGEFNVIPPAEYIAEGYQVSETTNGHGYYEVVPVV
jgi:hypothetical protein